MPTYAYAANNPLRYVDVDGLRPINSLGDVVARYMDVARAYVDWQKTQMSPVTPWPQLLYAENWVRALAGRQQRFLPGAEGDGACGGAARSFADYLRRNVDMEDVAVREPTGPWTLGDSHTTVRVSFHARDGSSSMDLGFDPFNAGFVPDGIEAGRSEFRIGDVAVQTIAPLGGVGWFR